jgi:hypothetical protein
MRVPDARNLGGAQCGLSPRQKLAARGSMRAACHPRPLAGAEQPRAVKADDYRTLRGRGFKAEQDRQSPGQIPGDEPGDHDGGDDEAGGDAAGRYGRVGDNTSEISISDFYRQAWNARIVGFISPVPEETKGEDLAILAGLVADGRLRPRIGLVLDWRKTAEAFAALTRREVRGKAVMTIG